MQWLQHPFLQIHGWWIMGCIGLVIGSFLTLISDRLPKEKTLWTRRSHCPTCSAPLAARDLIPVLSFLLLNAKARCCNTRISWRYPLIELCAGLGAMGLTLAFGLHGQTLFFIALWWVSLALIAADLEHYILPDSLLIWLAALGMGHLYHIQAPVMGALSTVLIGFFTGFTLRYGAFFLLKRPGLGLGDVKLFTVSGVWLAAPIHFIPFIFYAGISGVIFAMVWRLLGRGNVFPFGPALLLSLLIITYFPESARIFWQLYL